MGRMNGDGGAAKARTRRTALVVALLVALIAAGFLFQQREARDADRRSDEFFCTMEGVGHDDRGPAPVTCARSYWPADSAGFCVTVTNRPGLLSPPSTWRAVHGWQ